MLSYLVNFTRAGVGYFNRPCLEIEYFKNKIDFFNNTAEPQTPNAQLCRQLICQSRNFIIFFIFIFAPSALMGKCADTPRD